MKVSFDFFKGKKVQNNNSVAFQGIKQTKSDDGFKEYEFSYPYDENRDDCYLEVYKLDKDKYNNYFTKGRATNRFDSSTMYKMKPGANKIDFARTFGIDDNAPFAYHYVLVDKNSKYQRIRIDAGDSIDERAGASDPDDRNKAVFNIAIPTKSGLSKGGSMKLVIIDSQKVGYVYNDQNVIVRDEKLAKRGENGIKTLTNKFGGTLAGLEHAVDNGEYDNYGRIISLPVFTDDDFTSHAYWNKNCMQMASSLGNINNYASLQRKMFAHGLNFVSDGAFVNEGLEGVHFKHLLKWGADSPYFNWFRASGLKDNPLSMGVFVKNKNYISHKVVNSPYIYSQDKIGHVSIKKKSKNDPTYDPKKPTYIQFFDTRLVNDIERNDTTSLIKTYSKMSTENVYDLHTHNDSVFPYAFEINPEEYNDNIKRLNEYNSSNYKDEVLDLSSPKAARIVSKFKNFEVEGKFESGFETWDANPDIAKLNFVFSNADTKALKNIEDPNDKAKEMAKIERANSQVQDYAVTSGQYWTKKTDDILRLSIAQKLRRLDMNNPSKVYDTIRSKSNGKIFPKTLPEDVSKIEVENVLYGMYQSKRKLSNEDKKSQILQGLMNTPLDSFEFGDNIVSVLASPLISKRATTPAEIGVPRYDIYKNGNKHLLKEYKETYDKMDNLYTHEMLDYAEKVLGVVNSELPENNKLFDGDKVTDFGKYVLPLVTPEIAKYAVVRSLAPDLTVAIDKTSGEITYDYKTLKQLSLQGVGVTNPSSPKDEAEMLISTMKKGMKNLDFSPSSEIVDSIVKSVKDTSVEAFELADLIVDKTQSGLDWRIDATKDIADVEALRNENTNFDYTWQSVINFWKKFNKGVLQNNPNAYLVAEVTDENSLYDKGLGRYSGKFSKHSDIVSKFERETGMTSTANYSYFFTDVAKMFTKCFEDGSSWEDSDYLQKLLFEKMVGGGNYLKSGSLPSIEYSYTFIGNHDKPRALHCAAMDMGMFYTDLNYPDNYDNRLKAYKMITNNFFDYINPHDVNNYDFSAVSPKAVAMGYALRKAFIDVLNNYKNEKHEMSDSEFQDAFVALSQSISDLSQGKFMGRRFDPDAFGIKPFDVSIDMVVKQARNKYNLHLPPALSSKFEDDVFEKALDPAISKLLGMMKYLVALPGMPTLFDGDDVGATGYDTKTKNMYLQGRQRVHDEWLDVGGPKYKSFIDKHKKEFDEVMSIRKNPKCNALNNGAPFTLPLQTSEQGVKCPVILRQSTDGKMAISIFNPSGLHSDNERYYSPERQTFDSIKLNFENKKDNNGHEYTVFEDGANGVGITGLKNDTVFVNAKDPNDLYYVNEHDGKYFLKRGCDNGKITVEDSTLILYHVPEKSKLSFTGQYDIKPSMNFVTNMYKTNNVDCGKKLALYK